MKLQIIFLFTIFAATYILLFLIYYIGIAIMVIQHFVPAHIDECPKCRIYYENVMVWICGSFAIVGMLSALSMIPVQIGRRRRDGVNGLLEHQAILPQSLETESDIEA